MKYQYVLLLRGEKVSVTIDFKTDGGHSEIIIVYIKTRKREKRNILQNIADYI